MMSEKEKDEKLRRGRSKQFLKHVRKTERAFRTVLQNDIKISVLISENEARLVSAVRGALRETAHMDKVPLLSDGTPYLYRWAHRFFEDQKTISRKSIGESLLSADRTSFYDEELTLLSAFLTLSAAAFYVKRRKEEYLTAILQLQTIDFQTLFFEFSKIEQIFRSEAAGVYIHSDMATRGLYHERLAHMAKENALDPIAAAKKVIASANEKETHIGAVMPARRGKDARLYFFFIFLMTAALLAVYGFFGGASFWNLLLLPMAVIPFYVFAKIWIAPFFADAGEKILPKLSDGEAFEKTKTLVSIATFLFGEAKDKVIFDKLEDFYLTNKGKNVAFAVLGDLPQSQKRTAAADEATFAYAQARIRALREKYGDHFYLFIRERRFSACEGAYIGWERKRGGVLELCRHLRGKQTSILSFFDDEFLKDTEYLITLDADTNLYIGAVREMLGTMLHPENKPVYDETKGIVISGHGILQPRMIPSLMSSARTAFARLTGGAAGLDMYAQTTSDFYQQIFDEGIYCGKGIMDIDMFLRVCDGFFPRERILSHDLAEGNLLRAGLLTDVVLSDGTPKNALSYYMRGHRWLRGDLQITKYLFRTVKNEKGVCIRNPMSALSKYKILDNVLQSVSPLCTLALMAAGFLLGGKTGFVTAFFVLLPILWRMWEAVFDGMCHRAFSSFSDAVSLAWFRLSSIAYDAYLFSDAFIRTAYRFLHSKRNFLNWTTAFEGDSISSDSLDAYALRFLPSAVIGALFLCIPYGAAKFFGILWVTFPLAMWILSREKRETPFCGEAEKRKLLHYTRDAWLYFRDHVDENTNGLPPDNMQISPTHEVAMRTSPTNIGMYLLSVLAARDMDFIGSEELYIRCEMTARTISKLLKWNGHLYNWYDLNTLNVLGEPFVSTVDSGNFVASLIAFCEGAKDYIGEEPRLIEVIRTMESFISQTDFSALYHEERRLFYIGYSVERGSFSESYYDTFMSEARTTSFLATAFLSVPRAHFFAPSRRVIGGPRHYGVASWSGTAFEYFMPMLFLPRVKGSLTDLALSYAFRIQNKRVMKRRHFGRRLSAFGISESGYFAFDGVMNYQYHAFGIASLGLNPTMQTGKVLAPYASFLMLECDVGTIMKNLSSLEALGMYGKYGFYEALDFDPARVGKGYAVIRSYMAHHVGMSILAAVNLLKGGVFRKRFLKNPYMRASRELLAEKIPRSVFPLPKKRERTEICRRRISSEAIVPWQSPVCNLLYPEMALLSNNKTKIFLSSSGHMEIVNGRELFCLSDFDRFSLKGGLQIYVNVDGTVFPTVLLGNEPSGYEGTFSFYPFGDKAEYRSRHTNGTHSYEIRLTVSVFPDAEITEFCCAVSGEYGEAFAVLYFEPIMTDRRSYLSHKSFSDLFLESEYHDEEGVLLYRRRPRSDKKAAKYLGASVFPNRESDHFETMRDRCFPLFPDGHDYSALAQSERHFSDFEGAVILPACALRSDTVRKGKISFLLGSAADADDLLYLLSRERLHGTHKRRKQAMGALLHLQYSSAGLASDISALEQYLLRRMTFSSPISFQAEAAIDKNSFWRFGISGENKLVTAELHSGDEDELSRLYELFRLFKYLCIRGLRYDFIVFYRERDAYAMTERQKITDLIRAAGCENFVSFACGIYPLESTALMPSERFAYDVTASAHFSLASSIARTMESADTLTIAKETEKKLLAAVQTAVLPCAEPTVAAIREVKSGLFHSDGFLVKKPHAGAPFAHILSSGNFGTVMTENSLGFTFARNAGMQKLTPHSADGFYEDTGERLFIRFYDRFDKRTFYDYDLCACAAFVDYRFDEARYYGQIEGVSYTVSVSLVGKHDAKRISVSLEKGNDICSAKIGFLVTPCLSAVASAAKYYRLQKEENAIRIRSVLDRNKANFNMAVLCAETDAAYTDMAAIRSDGDVFCGLDEAAALVCNRTFEEKTETSFYLISYFSEKQYRFLKNLCLSDGVLEKFEVFACLDRYSLTSAYPLFDEIFNHWSLYQVLVSRIYARSGFYQVSGAYGFRDQLQDSLALIPVMPQMTKTMILRAAAHQYEDGGVQHWWHVSEKTGIRTRCSDDFLWLPFVTAEYVKQTGDTDILNVKIAYLASPPLVKEEQERYERAEISPVKESLFEHLLRAVAHGRKYGAHGLPLIGSCDWNDGMNLVGFAGKGESVWLAFFTVLVLRRMEELCYLYGETVPLTQIKSDTSALLQSIRENCFDGEWYRRGYYDDGSVLGGNERGDCKIDVLPQAFAAILSAETDFEKERAMVSMDAVYRLLYDKDHSLVRVLWPPFDKDGQSPGYIKGYVPGIRENGGQYTHAAVWAALGFFMCGDYEKGTELLFAINPAERYENEVIAKKYRIEPYVFAGDVYANPDHMGRGGWSFYTGSAGWYRKVVLEVLCGYTEMKEGFYLRPKLSSRFSSFEFYVSKKNTTYRISVRKADSSQLLLDGRAMENDHFFLFDGGSHTAVLQLRLD